MSTLPLTGSNTHAAPITGVTQGALEDWLNSQPDNLVAWLNANDFCAEAGATCLFPAPDGKLGGVVLGLGDGRDAWVAGRLARSLPEGSYKLDDLVGIAQEDRATAETWVALSWCLGSYRFHKYKTDTKEAPNVLVCPKEADFAYVEGAAKATNLTRNLINMPAEDMSPDALASEAIKIASYHGGVVSVIVGEDLLKEDFPAIHAVGRAAASAPRLIDLTWGQAEAPKVTLVGKGVCFDSGGLDIKPSSAMSLMKKDMGGAATVLGLANWIMSAQLPVRLRVLIPAVENAIAGNAFRPGDVIKTRKGMTIEVGNTDAEGRVILADALSLACEEEPELVIDCATLTGAARVALGPELPALFTTDDKLAAQLVAAGEAYNDPLWRLPLWSNYCKLISSKVADINNAGESGFAGAITAALFLKSFVKEDIAWAHFDIFGWNPDDKPGRPLGGEAQAQRALFAVISERFC